MKYGVGFKKYCDKKVVLEGIFGFATFPRTSCKKNTLLLHFDENDYIRSFKVHIINEVTPHLWGLCFLVDC